LPTPIQHLVIAKRILSAPELPACVRARLDTDDAVRGAFFFGHIAPDVQVVSRQSRESTHFFTLPPTSPQPAFQTMFETHPQLARPDALPATQAAFILGYISHLMLDQAWAGEIFYPIFGPKQAWDGWRERLLLHNVLRAWLDRRDLPAMPADVDDLLGHARPHGWLPPERATDADLCRWRDLVADQFAPGAAIRTVEIFANRARVPDAEFLALLEPEVMAMRIFSHISVGELDAFYERAIARTFDLTLSYLNGCALGESV